MRLCVAFLVCALSSAKIAWTAPISVRGGEHEEFTRLVFRTDPNVEWEISQNGRDVEISFDDHEDGFRLNQAFDRIQRNRVSDISAIGNSLLVKLACDCDVTSTRLNEDLLILDIYKNENEVDTSDFAEEDLFDEPDTSQSQLPQSGATGAIELVDILNIEVPDLVQSTAIPGNSASSANIQENVSELQAPNDTFEEVQLPLFTDNSPSTSLNIPAFSPANLENTTSPEVSAVETESLLRVQNLEDRLVRRIGQAATQGILEPADTQPSDQGENSSQVTVDITRNSDDIHNLPGLVPETPPNLRVRSSIDLEEQLDNELQSTLSGLSCPNETLFAIFDWGNDGGFSYGISEMRSSLFGEFDRLDEDAQVSLAKLYTYFGFGAEALAIRQLDPKTTPEHAALWSMAMVLEYGATARISALAKFTECDSDIALWAVLTADPTQHDYDIADNAALRALNKLPTHLRRILAPELSKKFRNFGNVDAANMALRTVKRLPADSPLAVRLETAEIESAKGNIDAASDLMQEVVETGADEAVEALISFIDLKVANKEPLSEDIVLLTEAYLAEYRAQPLGPRLARAHVMALAKSGYFKDAFENLDKAAQLQVDIEELTDSLFSILASDADDVTFLSRVTQNSAERDTHLADRTSFEIAKRLYDLGFPNLSEKFLEKTPENLSPRERALLAANLHLADGDPASALQIANSFEGENFDVLRGNALFLTGRYSESAEVFEALNMMEYAERSLWKLAQREGTSESPSENLNRLLSYDIVELNDSEPISLETVENTLDNSDNLLRDVEAVLQDPIFNF